MSIAQPVAVLISINSSAPKIGLWCRLIPNGRWRDIKRDVGWPVRPLVGIVHLNAGGWVLRIASLGAGFNRNQEKYYNKYHVFHFWTFYPAAFSASRCWILRAKSGRIVEKSPEKI